uniref:Putative secreted peptide n=1 Tax=Anopheles braziliensis TaxID=58242 RepID=A0A2M3ZUW8_9DIPT
MCHAMGPSLVLSCLVTVHALNLIRVMVNRIRKSRQLYAPRLVLVYHAIILSPDYGATTNSIRTKAWRYGVVR